MSGEQKHQRNTAFIIIGFVFIVIGVWMWVDAVHAIRTGTIIPAGRRSRAMTGDESAFTGTIALVIGAWGVWTGFKGKRY